MKNKTLSIWQFCTALGIIFFWIYFFLEENSNPTHSKIYLSFERSFPLPDLLWIMPLLLLSAYCRNDPFGVVTTIASGSALVFLALVDFSFNWQQNIYSSDLGLVSGIVNSYCLLFGCYSIFLGNKAVRALQK